MNPNGKRKGLTTTNTAEWQKEIGQRIAVARHNLGLTQGDLCQQSGLTIGTIGSAERGDAMPTIPTLAYLANILEMTLDDLVLGPNYPRNTTPEFPAEEPK